MNGSNTTTSVCEVSIIPTFNIVAFVKDAKANAATLQFTISPLMDPVAANISTYLALNFPYSSIDISVDNTTALATVYFTYD